MFGAINSKLYLLNQYIIQKTIPENVYVVKKLKDISHFLGLLYLIFEIMQKPNLFMSTKF